VDKGANPPATHESLSGLVSFALHRLVHQLDQIQNLQGQYFFAFFLSMMLK
jgi:hypothetical protein